MSWRRKFVGVLHEYAQHLSGLGIAVVVSASIVPQTLGLSRYRSMLAHYRDNKEAPIDGDTQELISKVLARVNLQPEQEAGLNFITSFPNDPVHKGSLQMRTGAFVGLPATFAYKTVDAIDRDSILIENRRYVDWSTETAQSLLGSLVIGDKAKAFVIAREVYDVRGFHLHIDCALRYAFGVLAYVTGFTLNRKTLLRQRIKLWARLGVYSSIAAGWLVMYVAINDAFYCWRDNHVDRLAARLKRVYADGGVEYYESVLRRNRALRELQGTAGEKRYTKFGNEVTVLRTPHVQLTSRLDNLRKYLQEYDKKDFNREDLESTAKSTDSQV